MAAFLSKSRLTFFTVFKMEIGSKAGSFLIIWKTLMNDPNFSAFFSLLNVP